MTRLILSLICSALFVAGSEAPASAQVTYVAFAQAGGFDTSRAYGFGTAPTLAAAITMAHDNCTKVTTSCGDEGNCAMRPGMFSAWASNRVVAGGRGVACNYPTVEQAEARAMAECGTIHLGNPPPCEVLWSGPKTGRAETLDDLKAWVRTNFQRVVGRSPSETNVNEYADQLQAWATRAPMQQGKDFLLQTVFPSLR